MLKTGIQLTESIYFYLLSNSLRFDTAILLLEKHIVSTKRRWW